MVDSFKELEEILKKDERLIANDGTLLINEIINYSSHLDSTLLKLLLSNSSTKNMFFKDVDGVMVFDSQMFNWTINSKKFLPDSYTRFSQSIGLVDLNNSFLKKSEDVLISFPNKDCFLEFDSTKEDEERNEVFFNEVLAKNEIDVIKDNKVFCNVKKYNSAGESDCNTFENDNLIIKGNNLLTLYSLLPRYKGSIKLMYWDILFNTNNDTVPYNDSFKHSSWLVMMKNRLEIAKKLLKQDGIICLQCDKNEDAYLKVLCDEIFGRDNYINTITIKTSTPSGTKTAHRDKTIIKTKDSLLIYSNGGAVKVNPQYIPRTTWDSHFTDWIEKENGKYVRKKVIEKMRELSLIDNDTKLEDIDINDKEIKKFYIDNAEFIGRWTSHKNKDITQKCLQNQDEILEFFDDEGKSKGIYLNKGVFSPIKDGLHMVKSNKKDELLWSMLLCDIWTDVDFQNTQNEGNNSLPAGKKPEFLIRRIIDMFTEKGDIVLDAYLGSGTTAAVSMKMERKFIGIEQLDSHIEKSLIRMKNVINGDQSGISEVENWKGGGEFVYCELANNTLNYIKKIQSTNDDKLDELYEELCNNDFLNYRIDKELLKEQKTEFSELSIDDKRKILMEIIDKNILYINYSEIDNNMYDISNNDKEFTRAFYNDK